MTQPDAIEISGEISRVRKSVSGTRVSVQWSAETPVTELSIEDGIAVEREFTETHVFLADEMLLPPDITDDEILEEVAAKKVGIAAEHIDAITVRKRRGVDPGLIGRKV